MVFQKVVPMTATELSVVLGLGFKVFPCRARTLDAQHKAKAPFTDHGKNDASDAPGQIEEWARRYPGCAWGARPPKGITVLDIDTKGQDGFATLRGLEAQHGELPADADQPHAGQGAASNFCDPGRL
jgi:Bifunctional DNA primase/polymerase, N-terminal